MQPGIGSGIVAHMHEPAPSSHAPLRTAHRSPERINNQAYSFPADIWSLGLALVELATGRYPYDAGEGPLQLMIHVRGTPGLWGMDLEGRIWLL